MLPESKVTEGTTMKQDKEKEEEEKEKMGEDEEKEEEMAEDEYEVEKILKRRVTEKGKVMLYVKWKGWDAKWNTWEPEDALDEVEQYEEFLKQFEEKRFLVPGTKGGSMKGFDRGFQVETILATKRGEDGKHLFQIKWAEADITEWVPVEDADDCCPLKVIEFYDKHIKWGDPLKVKPYDSTNCREMHVAPP